jgi:hypothetical protein
LLKTRLVKILTLTGIVLILHSCSTRDPFLFCEKEECSYSQLTPGVVSIAGSIGDQPEYFALTDKGLKRLDSFKTGTTLFAYDQAKQLAGSKKQNTGSFSVSVFDIRNRKEMSNTVFPESVVSIISGCFLDDSSLVVLLVEDGEDLSRRYFISISSEKNLKEWSSYLIKEESRNDLIERMLSLGAAYERPVSIQCSKENMYVNTLTSFSDMLAVNIYKFDLDLSSLVFETGYHPLNVKGGPVSIYFNEKNFTGYIHQDRELIIAKGTDFPVKTIFDEPGEVFFSPFASSGSMLLYFIPSAKNGFRKSARIIDIK